MPVYDLSFKANDREITVGVVADSAEKAREAFKLKHPLAEITKVVEVADTDPVVRL